MKRGFPTNLSLTKCFCSVVTGWVAKWVERSKQGELGDHAQCGRPKILTQAAIKNNQKGEIQTRIWIKTDRKISQVFYFPNSRNDTVWGSQEENVPVASQVKFSPTFLVWGGMTASGLTRLHFVPRHTSINSEYYINNILKKELKPVYARLDTSGTISKRHLFTDNSLAFSSRMVREHIHLLFREHG